MAIAIIVTVRGIRMALTLSMIDRNFIYDAFCDRTAGLRVASTFRLPHLLHRRRFTNAAIGVPGVIAKRNNAAPVSTPT
jgi:hypothetical protein